MNITIDAQKTVWNPLGPLAIVSTITLSAGLVLLCFFAQSYQLGPWAKFKDTPPGPPSGILTGTPNFVLSYPHIWWNELAKKYGPIVSVWRGQKMTVVLSNPEDIQELLNKRGTTYSSRPPMHVFHDILFKGLFIPSCAHNDIWRRQRKIITSLIGIRAVKDLLPCQYYESEQMMNDLVDSPQEFFMHAERFGSSILTATVYGYRSHDITHPSAKALLLIGGWIEHKLSPTRYKEDAWPIIQKVPNLLAWWRKQYYKDAEIVLAMAKAWWDPCKERVRSGIVVPCFATQFVQQYEAEGWTDEEAALVTFGLMLAGAGTTGATINFFIMACCKYPETVLKAQEELDRVVGDKRYPTMQDEPDLPYVRAMIKENNRWRPISNQGVPHSTTRDDVYKGYRIPKGTTVVANAYAIHHNETKYPNPDQFEPERFVDYKLSAVDSANLRDADKRDHWAYGAGRRICAGIHVAEASLFIVCSRLLWGFKFDLAADANGKAIPIDDTRYNGDLFGKPYTFAAKLTPRSPERAEFMKKTFAGATTNVLSLKDASDNGKLGDISHLCEMLEADAESTAH